VPLEVLCGGGRWVTAEGDRAFRSMWTGSRRKTLLATCTVRGEPAGRGAGCDVGCASGRRFAGVAAGSSCRRVATLPWSAWSTAAGWPPPTWFTEGVVGTYEGAGGATGGRQGEAGVAVWAGRVREAGRKQTGRGKRRRWAVALSMATSSKERGRAGAGNFACSRQGGA